MSDRNEVVVSSGDRQNSHRWLPGPIQRLQDGLVERREEKRVLTENEHALRRMSEISQRIVALSEDPAFKDRADVSKQNVGEQGWDNYHLHIPSTSHGRSYGITIEKDPVKNIVLGISVFVSPSNDEEYSTGRNDGHFRIQMTPDYTHEVKKDKRDSRPTFVWFDSVIQGDAYLGKETAKDIEELSVSHLSTQVHLDSVDFGGWPSISLVLDATARSKDGKYLGPISKITGIQVLGVARAASPVTGHVADSESVEVDFDKDFVSMNHPFVFQRGEADFQAAKTNVNGKEMLAFRFSGIRKRLGVDREHPIIVGPEHRDIAVSTDLANGQKVLDLFDKALDEVISACKETTPQLKA